MLNDIERYKSYIKNELSDRKYKHSLDVAKIAVKIAGAHDLNVEDAEIAGILHDLAREWDYTKAINFVEERGISLTEDQKKLPVLLHGLVASIITEEKFGILDRDILDSIKNHTLGAEKMSDLEKIVFISDMVASSKGIDISQEILNTAFESLEKAVILTYWRTNNYFLERNLPIAQEFINNWEANKELVHG